MWPKLPCTTRTYHSQTQTFFIGERHRPSSSFIIFFFNIFRHSRRLSAGIARLIATPTNGYDSNIRVRLRRTATEFRAKFSWTISLEQQFSMLNIHSAASTGLVDQLFYFILFYFCNLNSFYHFVYSHT